MKSFFRALRPNSFFGQLLLLMLIGAVLLQVINFCAVYSIQNSYSKEFLNIGHDYISSVFQIMRHMDEGQRTAALEDLAKSRGMLDKPFRFRAVTEGPTWETQDYFKAIRARDTVKKSIEASGLPVPDIRARVIGVKSPEADSPVYCDHLFPLLQVMIQIDDNNWMELVQTMVLTDSSLIRRQRALILVGSLTISLVMILIIRRTTKPLRKLREAAEMFGYNPERAHPLKEEGSIEVRETAQSFNMMRRRICDNLHERNRMLEAMGHDLRTPLARVQLRIKKIQPDSLREKFAANIDEIQSIIEQGIELAQSLHTSEKIVPLDITAFIESIVDDMGGQERNITLSQLSDDETSPLLSSARATCLRRGVENLITNALKYAGSAYVSVQREKNNVVIDIDDNGPGVPENLLEKIFEPYYRIEGSRSRESGGTGLGLSIARNMILLNEGSLVLSNRPKGGLKARIVMPLMAHMM